MLILFVASAPSTSVFGTTTFGSSSTNNIFGESSQALVPTVANPVPATTASASPFKLGLGQNESQLNTSSSTTNEGFKFGQDSQKPFQFGNTQQEGMLN